MVVYNTKEISTAIRNMRNEIFDDLNNELSRDYYVNKYNILAENTPQLFDLIHTNDIDYLPMVEYFLDNIKRIEDNEESKESVDLKIGEKLAEQYLYPYVDVSKEDDLEKTKKDIYEKNKSKK
jgi:hypothetical protein